jgi:hypothetical protein
MGRCVALGSVCRPLAGSHLTCPFGLHNPPGSCRVVHQAHVSRLSARATRPYPPGYDFPVPYGGWPSLLGPSYSRCGFGPSFRRSSGLLAQGPDRNGVTAFRTRRGATGAGASCTAGPGCPSARYEEDTGPWPDIAASAIGCGDLPVTQPPQRFTRVRPSRLSLARWARMTRACLGLHPPAFACFVTWHLRGSGTDVDTHRDQGAQPLITLQVRLSRRNPSSGKAQVG